MNYQYNWNDENNKRRRLRRRDFSNVMYFSSNIIIDWIENFLVSYRIYLFFLLSLLEERNEKINKEI